MWYWLIWFFWILAIDSLLVSSSNTYLLGMAASVLAPYYLLFKFCLFALHLVFTVRTSLVLYRCEWLFLSKIIFAIFSNVYFKILQNFYWFHHVLGDPLICTLKVLFFSISFPRLVSFLKYSCCEMSQYRTC